MCSIEDSSEIYFGISINLLETIDKYLRHFKLLISCGKSVILALVINRVERNFKSPILEGNDPIGLFRSNNTFTNPDLFIA
jgi:hypothetical protein